MANSSLDEFNKALLSKNHNYNRYALKVKFKVSNDENEHIWLDQIIFKDHEYTGVVNNVPKYIREINVGDKIKINKKNISDWMYTDGKNLRGGFTIRVMRDRMSESEKNQFDSEYDFIIDDKLF